MNENITKNEILELCVELEESCEKEIQFELEGLKNILKSGGYSQGALIGIIKDKGDILQNLFLEKKRIQSFKSGVFKKTLFMKALKTYLLKNRR